jgi:hypothetical protein
MRDREKHARHGTVNGYAVDRCRCQECKRAWREYYAARRAEQRKVRGHLTTAAQVAQAKRREEELAAVKSDASLELAELIREQEKDSYFVIHHRPWLLSLDAIWGDSDSEEDHYERGGVVVHIARKRGDFETEAPWIPPLLDRIDRERELERLAS